MKEKEKEKDKNIKAKECDRIFINKEKKEEIFDEFKEPMVSLFENCFSTEPNKKIRITNFLFTHRLPNDKIKQLVADYRKTYNDDERKKKKQSLKCATISGTFFQRQESFIDTHTNLICIDIDSKDNGDIDLANSKHLIGQYCPSLYYAGLSLGGEGIFLIFRISNPEYHKEHFEALSYYLREKFDLSVDTAVKSPASLRAISYDENPYYNPNPVPFQHIIRIGDKVEPVIRTVTEKNTIRKHVEKAIEIIWKNKVDITNGYEKWFKIGCALAHEFGEEGRDWFHMISRMYKDFHETDCDIQYSRCLKYKTESGVKIGTFFYYCKKYGIEYKRE